MLIESDLLTISSKPKLADVSLQLYANFYENYLCSKVFSFDLDNEQHAKVQVQFGKGDMCHLLGIQHVVYKRKDSKKYAGVSGYKKLKNGTLSFDFLKKTNKAMFDSKKNRMLYFPFLYQVVTNPTVLLYKNSGLTRVSADLMFYNERNGTYFHLGIIKDDVGDFYSPVTFYDRNNEDHIANQQLITIKDKAVLDANAFISVQDSGN